MTFACSWKPEHDGPNVGRACACFISMNWQGRRADGERRERGGRTFTKSQGGEAARVEEGWEHRGPETQDENWPSVVTRLDELL